MEASELRDVREKLGATGKEMARILGSSLAHLMRWEEGSARIPPGKAALLESLKLLAQHLANEPLLPHKGEKAIDHLRAVLIQMGAENFLFLLAKEKPQCLPRSCWRRLAAVKPAIGFLIGAPVGMVGALCSSSSVRSLLEMLEGNATRNAREREKSP